MPVENGRTETLPVRPTPQSPGDPYGVDLPVEFGDEAGRRADGNRNGTNGAHADNGLNGHAPNGNGNGYVSPPAPRDGATDEAVAQRNRPS